MNNVVIREARRADAKAVVEYCRKVGSETDNLSYSSEDFRMTELEKGIVLEVFAQSTTDLYLVAELAGQIIGSASMTSMKNLRMEHNSTFGISVLCKYNNAGIGSKLMEYLINFAVNHEKLINIYLEVRADNEQAIALYEKYNFIKCGMLPNYLRVNDEYHDVIKMYRPV